MSRGRDGENENVGEVEKSAQHDGGRACVCVCFACVPAGPCRSCMAQQTGSAYWPAAACPAYPLSARRRRGERRSWRSKEREEKSKVDCGGDDKTFICVCLCSVRKAQAHAHAPHAHARGHAHAATLGHIGLHSAHASPWRERERRVFVLSLPCRPIRRPLRQGLRRGALSVYKCEHTSARPHDQHHPSLGQAGHTFSQSSMDLHHRLRRDPTWHKDGCNICGRVGHQAGACPNGSIDWLAAYGSMPAYVAAFTPAPDTLAAAAERAARKAGPAPEALAAMAAAASAWAAGRAASGAAAGEPVPPARRPPRQAAGPPSGYQHRPGGGPAGPLPPPAAAAGPPPPPLPPGWRAAWDPRKGRHYFYARSDRSKVTWAVPTVAAP